jgi:hypothetical protein
MGLCVSKMLKGLQASREGFCLWSGTNWHCRVIITPICTQACSSTSLASVAPTVLLNEVMNDYDEVWAQPVTAPATNATFFAFAKTSRAKLDSSTPNRRVYTLLVFKTDGTEHALAVCRTH